MKPAKPLTRTHETPTRKTWGKGLTGMGTGWPGIPQGYPWYSLFVTTICNTCCHLPFQAAPVITFLVHIGAGVREPSAKLYPILGPIKKLLVG